MFTSNEKIRRQGGRGEREAYTSIRHNHTEELSLDGSAGESRMADPKQRTRCADMYTGAQHHESNCGCAWHRTELDQ
jgi:hypothetical protein